MSSSGRPRRQSVLQTAGLVVEGETEFFALPRLVGMGLPRCPPLKAINLRGVGSDILPIAIARRALPKVKEHLAAKRAPVVVCLDRESRDVSASKLESEIAAELHRLLTAEGRSTAGVFVVAADRAFEAWLLADAEGLHTRGVFKKKPTFVSFEGQIGKQRRKGVVELGELLGRAYAKTIDGPRVFEQIEVTAARDHLHGARGSRSFDAFLRCLGV